MLSGVFAPTMLLRLFALSALLVAGTMVGLAVVGSSARRADADLRERLAEARERAAARGGRRSR